MWTRTSLNRVIDHLLAKIHLPLKQHIHHFNQFFDRTVVVDQFIFTPLLRHNILIGIQECQHVAATEAINRLFTVTHHNHATFLVTLWMPPDARQHIILILIGILKLIHQNQWITCLYKYRKMLSLFAL